MESFTLTYKLCSPLQRTTLDIWLQWRRFQPIFKREIHCLHSATSPTHPRSCLLLAPCCFHPLLPGDKDSGRATLLAGGFCCPQAISTCHNSSRVAYSLSSHQAGRRCLLQGAREEALRSGVKCCRHVTTQPSSFSILKTGNSQQLPCLNRALSEEAPCPQELSCIKLSAQCLSTLYRS